MRLFINAITIHPDQWTPAEAGVTKTRLSFESSPQTLAAFAFSGDGVS